MSLSKRKKTKGSKRELTIKQKRIVELAKVAWAKTLKEFYYPPLNEPTFLFDYTHLEGFYIDPENQWEITMNLANTPLFNDDQEYIDYFHIISLHEVSHYQIIPYDGLTNAKLLRAAIENVNLNYAPIVVNIFADLIIDYRLYKKYPDLITWEVQTTYEHIKNKGRMSNFAKFLFRAYEKIWNVNILNDDSLKSMDPRVKGYPKLSLKILKMSPPGKKRFPLLRDI